MIPPAFRLAYNRAMPLFPLLMLWLWAIPLAHALPLAPMDPQRLAAAGGGSAWFDGYHPRRNPAAGALYSGREDVRLRLFWGPRTRRTPWAGGEAVRDQRLLGGELGLPRLPLALGAYTQARFQRIQGLEGGRLVTRELWRLESGADVARLLLDRAGQGLRIGLGLTPKLVSLRPRAAREDPALADPAAPLLRAGHDASLDMDLGLGGTFRFRWRWALVGRDLFAGRTPWPDGSGAFGGPHWRVAGAYEGPRWAGTVELDANATHRGLGGRERRLIMATRLHLAGVKLYTGVAPDLLGNGPLRWGLGVAAAWRGASVELGLQREGPGRGVTALGLGWSF